MKPMLIALIDDQLEIIEILEEILLGEGHQVISFTSANQAADHLMENKVDTALVDRSMPDMDGFTLITSIRRSPVNCRIPIAVITGFSDSESMRVAFKHGANFFIPKPITADKLRSVLNLITAGISSERRRSVRVEFPATVYCTVTSRIYELDGVMISETGALLSGYIEVERESMVDLNFCLPTAPTALNIRARVVERKENAQLSVEFVDIGTEELCAIKDYVAQKQATSSELCCNHKPT